MTVSPQAPGTSENSPPVLGEQAEEALQSFDLRAIAETRAISALHDSDTENSDHVPEIDDYSVMLYEVSSESFLVGEILFRGAYNTGVQLARTSANTDTGSWEWSPVTLPWVNADSGEAEQRTTVANPSWDRTTGRMETTMKTRGLGDCGTSSVHFWQVDDQSFCLHELRHQGECTGTDDEWPVVFTDDACSQSYTGHEAHADHEHTGHHHDHRFQDPSEHAARWESDARLGWQRPEELIQAMAISPGMVVADLGAGTGFLLPWLDEAVGESGRVIAVDIEQAMLDHIAQREDPERTPELVLAQPDRPPFNAGSIDRVVSVNVWHHIADRIRYAQALHRTLREGGRFYIVDYTPASPSGPPAGMRLSASEALQELMRAGLRPRLLVDSLPRQYIIEVR